MLRKVCYALGAAAIASDSAAMLWKVAPARRLDLHAKPRVALSKRCLLRGDGSLVAGQLAHVGGL